MYHCHPAELNERIDFYELINILMLEWLVNAIQQILFSLVILYCCKIKNVMIRSCLERKSLRKLYELTDRFYNHRSLVSTTWSMHKKPLPMAFLDSMADLHPVTFPTWILVLAQSCLPSWKSWILCSPQQCMRKDNPCYSGMLLSADG